MGSRGVHRQTKHVKPQRSFALIAWLVASFIPLLVLLGLFLSDVRLGQGFFATLYSPIAEWRFGRIAPMLLIGALACAAVVSMAQRGKDLRIAGRVMFALAILGFGGFAWFGPPQPVNQQVFNMTSRSTDGAFVYEGREVPSVGEYLRAFPDVTLRKSAQEMGGTRVLSNPPLTTILAYAVYRAGWHPVESPGAIERMLIEDADVLERDAPGLANGLRFSVVLCVLWTLSGFVAYGLGRVFLSPAGAAAFAIVVTFNPCTVHFSPGKDPAQLLTINAMLWAWFAAWKRKSFSIAAIGGAILTVGCTAGLIHAWVALVAVASTLWQSWRDGTVRVVLLNSIGAAVGGIVACLLAYVTIRWNIPYTLWAVSRRWTELQSTFNLSRPVWYAIGLPIFLLFVGPGIWISLGLSLHRPRLRFGTRLAICTAIVMLVIYLPLGMTYELPRLWVAFLPTLTLGLMIDRPLLRASSANPRAAVALVLLVAAHVVFTTLHWTLLDARESELRLTSDRFYS